MATQLTRRKIFASLSSESIVLRLPAHYLLAAAAACVAIVYASLVAGVYNAQRDERAAERVYADTLAINEAPPPDLNALTAQLEATNAELARAEALAATSTLDPASDRTTALLVTRAEGHGLRVSGVAHISPSQFKVDADIYDVQAVRFSVEGPPAAISGFLADLHSSEPALIATLTSLELRSGVALAEIVFSAYAKALPATPVAGAAR